MANITRLAAYVLLGSAAAGAAFAFGKAYTKRAAGEAAFAAIDAQKPVALLEARAADEAKLRSGPIPIDEAMRRFAMRGRLGLGEALQPKPSLDQAPLMGWSNTPKDVPDWMLATPPATDAGTTR